MSKSPQKVVSSKQTREGFRETIKQLIRDRPNGDRLQTLRATAQSCQWRFTDPGTHAYYDGVIQAIDAYREALR